SEAPIVYYFVAVLYKIFGYHEWMFRFLNTLLFFLGLLYLYKLMLLFTKDIFWSAALSLLFFTSPVMVYYGNNFLINTTALSLSMGGWFYFARYLLNREQKLFYFSLIFFFLAALLKVTALFSLICFIGIYVAELLNIKKTSEKLFPSLIKYLMPIIAVFGIVALWLLTVSNYNKQHDCTYFSTTAFPIWTLESEEIDHIINNVKNIWLSEYFHLSVLIFLFLSFLFFVFKIRKSHPLFAYAVPMLFLLGILYVLMQFRQFAEHDYYVIDLFVFPMILLIGLLEMMKREYPKVLSSIVVQIVFTFFLVFNVVHAHTRLNDRYESWMNDYPANKDYYTVTPYLRQIGITESDTVIVIPDYSNVSLYLIDQKGWTEYVDARFNREAGIPYNGDSAGIQASINKGAKYLILNGIEEFQKKPYIKPFANCLIGHYNKILVFKLKGGTRNFDADARDVKQRLTCDAENLSEDKKYFVHDNVQFEFGQTQNSEFSRSGNFSCKLDKKTPYGMTIRIKGAEEGESFAISVWRKVNPQLKSTIVASADSGFYDNNYGVTKPDSAGWEKITKEFAITPELKNKEVTIYLYNEAETAAYFDDLEIIIYKSPESKLDP
ncbi:MAG: glycosyltransferase family 39 protein, partial [Bacteroidia bacterium]